eukprot:CAMPEP_0196660534 /NCGR_PEP_ID=MMETSP1086-20130531/40210_1 /TAXON_ID=77921 /ORGANISM="Cyanoptyche  gloeocystis , Strain SAG4.97" /LENGTH=92 /DNA_ID=CAMNT_0041994989 /DNA_START=65 /DNA_END=340 /DNA_ORIENTATION=-
MPYNYGTKVDEICNQFLNGPYGPGAKNACQACYEFVAGFLHKGDVQELKQRLFRADVPREAIQDGIRAYVQYLGESASSEELRILKDGLEQV